MNIFAIWLQIRTQDVKIRPKTPLRSFSHEKLGWPKFWTIFWGLLLVLGPPGRFPMPGVTEKIVAKIMAPAKHCNSD